MKKIITALFILLCFGFLFSATSCMVMTPKKSGQQRGFTKSSNNSYHPMGTNPGKAKGHYK